MVDTENYLLACYHYIELNPDRAAMVEHPVAYPWSSYQVNAGMRPRRKLVIHDIYRCLGTDNKLRSYAYRELFSIELNERILHDIQRAVRFSMPLGNENFINQIREALSYKMVMTKEVGHLKSNMQTSSTIYRAYIFLTKFNSNTRYSYQ